MLSREAWLVSGWSSRRGLSGVMTGSAAQTVCAVGTSRIAASSSVTAALLKRWRNAAKHQLDIPGLQHACAGSDKG